MWQGSDVPFLYLSPPNPCLAFWTDLVFEVKARTTAQPSSPSLDELGYHERQEGPEPLGKTFSYLRPSNRSNRDLLLRFPVHNLTIQASHLHTNINTSKGTNHSNVFAINELEHPTRFNCWLFAQWVKQGLTNLCPKTELCNLLPQTSVSSSPFLLPPLLSQFPIQAGVNQGDVTSEMSRDLCAQAVSRANMCPEEKLKRVALWKAGLLPGVTMTNSEKKEKVQKNNVLAYS